jgi:hypothetical protein
LQVLVVDHGPPGQGRGSAGRPQRQERRPQRGDAQFGTGHHQRLDRIGTQPDRGQPAPRGRDDVGGDRVRGGSIGGDLQRQPVHQGSRGRLVDAFVQRDHPKKGGIAPGQAVTLGSNQPGIHRRRHARRHAGIEPLGHRHHDHAAIGLREQPGFRHTAPCTQRGRQIEPAE